MMIIEICKAPTPLFQALKHNVKHITYIEMENVMSNLQKNNENKKETQLNNLSARENS